MWKNLMRADAVLVYGFGGLRDSSGTLTMDPRLPDIWSGLTYRLTLRGTRVRVDLYQSEVTLTVEAGESATIEIRGEPVTVTTAGPVTVPLGDQGPRLIGAPTTRDLEGTRRADGTLVTATVPATRGHEYEGGSEPGGNGLYD